MLRARLIASGRVQGVGFRSFACRVGSSLGLVGFAKNLPDGTVEIVAEGRERKIAELRKRLSSVKMALGIRVDSLQLVERREIRKPSFASFGVQY